MHVTTISGTVYSGLIYAIMVHKPGEVRVALKQAQLVSGQPDTGFAPGGTFTIESHMFALLFVPSIDNLQPQDPSFDANGGGFSTDAEISGRSSEQLYGRSLKARVNGSMTVALGSQV